MIMSARMAKVNPQTLESRIEALEAAVLLMEDDRRWFVACLADLVFSLRELEGRR